MDFIIFVSLFVILVVQEVLDIWFLEVEIVVCDYMVVYLEMDFDCMEYFLLEDVVFIDCIVLGEDVGLDGLMYESCDVVMGMFWEFDVQY